MNTFSQNKFQETYYHSTTHSESPEVINFEENIKNFDIIVYHEYCSDGITSAWIVKNNENNNNSFLIPCKAGTNPRFNLNEIIKKNIIFVDICPSVEYLLTLCNIANNVVILDHHISAYRNIEEIENKPHNLFTVFDMNRSGCMITWDYFHDNSVRPWYVNYVGDRDLWKWELPDSKDINTALFEDKHISFNGLSNLAILTYEDENSIINSIKERGIQINKFRNQIIEKETKKAIHCTFIFDETLYNIWLYNGPEDLRSDIGNALMQINFKNGLKPDFAVNWRYDVKTHEFWLSMRGEEWSPDLSIICKKYNGGGHPKASGCSMSGNIELRSVFVPMNN